MLSTDNLDNFDLGLWKVDNTSVCIAVLHVLNLGGTFSGKSTFQTQESTFEYEFTSSMMIVSKVTYF